MATDLRQRLTLVNILFTPILQDKQTLTAIDEKNKYAIYTRAWDISKKYLTENILPTKDDLYYINKTVAKLISVMGKDVFIIDRHYIKTKLIIPHIFTASDWKDWIDAYKQLIKLIK